MENINPDILQKANNSIRPSSFVLYSYNVSVWCSVTKCEDCGLTGKYEDLHPADPCPRCGAFRKIHEKVGRWIKLRSFRPFWKFWEAGGAKGYWEVREK